ncbi:MAG: right-handed parallel beta-helix repeat-containing protein, partial [bacterium]|nr:right-handed parallel beta-helix repeat-containing protein [bacterium]
AGTYTIDNNLIDGFSGYSFEVDGENYIEGDPLFINPSVFNFRLQEGSPAIDNGSSINAPDIDFDGNTRPLGISYDIGAFESAL